MTNLSLFVQDPYGGNLEIDLDDVWIHSDVIDEDSMVGLLVHKIALWALENGNGFDDIIPLMVEDEDGQELEIRKESSNPHLWIREVVQLYMWLGCDRHWCPDEAILAYVDNQGWKWTNFDSDLQTAEDEFRSEFDGDYEEFAREWMSDMGECMEEHLKHYFDYSSYGEVLVDDFSRVSWGLKEYLFSQ